MDLKTRTLAWVNRIRVEKLGRKPLKSLRRGVRRSTRKCTLAVSLPGTSSPIFKAAGARIVDIKTMPRYVWDFAAEFDNGYYPELEIK